MRACTIITLIFISLLSNGCRPTEPQINIYFPDCANLAPLQEYVLSLSTQNIPLDTEFDWIASQGEIKKSSSTDSKMITYMPFSSGNVNIKVIAQLKESRTYIPDEINCIVTENTPAPVSELLPTRETSSTSTSTPQATSTLIQENTIIPEPTVVIASTNPTPTVMSIPTEATIPSPTMALSPEPIHSIILFQENFDDNSNGWLEQKRKTENSPQIVSEIKEGIYTHTVSCPSEYPVQYCGFYLPIPSIRAQDFHLELDANVRSGANSIGIELWFRRNGENRYGVAFYDAGFYNMYLYENRERPVLIAGATPASIMNKGDNVTNRLGIDVKDNIFHPLINGELFGPHEDKNRKLPGFGEFYIVLYVEKGGYAYINLDNLMITQPQE